MQEDNTHTDNFIKEETAPAKKSKKKKILLTVACSVLSAVIAFFALGQIGAWVSASRLHFWRPDYAMQDISTILEKETLTEEDYEVLYRQTGVTKLGIDDMRHTPQGKQRILRIQECLFEDYDLREITFGLFTVTEELGNEYGNQYSRLASLQDGDIIVSSSMYVSWWRFGHSALVVDSVGERVVEAIEPGYLSEYGHASDVAYRANFIILRPKVDAQTRQKVAQYAKDNLVGLRYDITAGIFSKKYEKNPTKSHCGHIVWRAYMEYGIDIDSNGGAVVTPEEIFRSEYMEVVQVFGFDLDKLWE